MASGDTCEAYITSDGRVQCGNCGYLAERCEINEMFRDGCPSCGAGVVSVDEWSEPDDEFWER